MKKLFAALLLTLSSLAQAAWVNVWSEYQGGSIYLENSTMQFSGPVSSGYPFLRVWFFTDYTSAINSDRVCYPSGRDCQWKKLSTLIQADFSCNNFIRVVRVDDEYDDGPTSESWSRESYTSPAARPKIGRPGPFPVPQTFNISGDRSLLTLQRAVCQYWPR